MAAIKNIIRKQTVHFQYNGKADGFALQREVGDWCRDVLLPQLEQQLEPYCRPDLYISLDKLDITADVQQANWQEQVQQQVLTAMLQQLANIPIAPLPSATAANPSTDKGKVDAAFLQAHDDSRSPNAIGKPLHALQPSTADCKADNQQEAPLQQQTAATVEAAKAAANRKTDELIIFFLVHGHLPWWGSALTNTQDFPLLFAHWVVSPKTPERANVLIQALQQNLSANLVQRILNHQPGHTVFRFVQSIVPDAKPQLAQVESFLSSFFQPIGKATPKSVSQQFYRQWLTNMLQASQVPSIMQTLEIWYKAIEMEISPKMAAEIFQQSSVLPKDNPLTKTWQQLLKQKHAAPVMATTQEVQPKAIEQGDKKSKTPQKAGRKEPATAKERVDTTAPLLTAKSKAVAIELAGGVFVENAGAVIVAPFLPTLFAKLNMAKEGSLLKPDMAALLVQYIVSGSKKINESQLLLPKILCGMEPDAPIDTNNKITPLQRKEVEALLESVVGHWAILKNTSTHGLREAFLQRNGKITFHNNQWLLQVEQKSYDMLLQQLPWNIGMIKLGWMKNLLKTEWV